MIVILKCDICGNEFRKEAAKFGGGKNASFAEPDAGLRFEFTADDQLTFAENVEVACESCQRAVADAITKAIGAISAGRTQK